MKDQIRAALIILERVVLNLSNEIKSVEGDTVPADLANRAVYTSEACKMLVSGWDFTPEERGETMLTAGWPAEEVQAMIDLLRAYDKLSAAVKKTDKPQLN